MVQVLNKQHGRKPGHIKRNCFINPMEGNVAGSEKAENALNEKTGQNNKSWCFY